MAQAVILTTHLKTSKMEQKKKKQRGRAGRPRREDGRDQRGRRAGRQGLPQDEAREAGTLAGLPALRPPRGLDRQFLQELLPPVQGADTLRFLPGGGGHGGCGAASHHGLAERPGGERGDTCGAQGGYRQVPTTSRNRGCETKSNDNEHIKRQKKWKKTEELKQEKDVQQPQAAETQETTAQQKPEKPNLIADGDVDWEELRKCGIDKEQLSEKDLKALMNYGKTGLVDVTPTLGDVTYSLQARLSFQKAEGGKLKLTPHFIRNEPRLDIPHRGYTFTDEDKKNIETHGQPRQAHQLRQ